MSGQKITTQIYAFEVNFVIDDAVVQKTHPIIEHQNLHFSVVFQKDLHRSRVVKPRCRTNQRKRFAQIQGSFEDFLFACERRVRYYDIPMLVRLIRVKILPIVNVWTNDFIPVCNNLLHKFRILFVERAPHYSVLWYVLDDWFYAVWQRITLVILALCIQNFAWFFDYNHLFLLIPNFQQMTKRKRSCFIRNGFFILFTNAELDLWSLVSCLDSSIVFRYTNQYPRFPDIMIIKRVWTIPYVLSIHSGWATPIIIVSAPFQT